MIRRIHDDSDGTYGCRGCMRSWSKADVRWAENALLG